MRLAELIATFSLAADAGMGMPMERGLRAAVLSARLAELSGVSEAEAGDAFYLALMRYLGCTADSHIAADVMGDEVAVRGALYGADWGSPRDFLPRLLRATTRGKGALEGALSSARALAKMPLLLDTGLAHCEVGDRLAAAMGFSAGFRASLTQTFERWDGRGWPDRLRGERIARSMRLAQLADEIEVGHRSGGAQAACALVKQRSGGGVDPELAECFERNAQRVCEAIEVDSVFRTALAAEPGRPREIGEARVDDVLAAMADFADLRSRFTRRHTRGVAQIAREAARRLGLTEEDCARIWRAALLHDLGRVAVSAAVWDKPAPLNDVEREQVRTHTYVGERILARAGSLASIAEIATLAHERLDGHGYHRRLNATSATMPGRILAAADVFRALGEARAYRPAHSLDQASALLSGMAQSGALCPEAVSAVLDGAGASRPVRTERPEGLTERELEVLRLVARGLTNKEVAAALGIAPKTAGHHLQHVFAKIGVTTRAGATLFAMQKGLLSV